MESPASETTYIPEPPLLAEDSELPEEPGALQPNTALARPSSPKPTSHRRAGLNHHRSHCTICRHPERDAIEQSFLHWERPTVIARDFQLADRRVVNRHALALDLFDLRSSRTRRSLEFIIEQAETVKATADSVIRAVKAHACLGEDGRWTEPVRHTIITHQYLNLAGPPAEQDLARDQAQIGTPSKRTSLFGAALNLIRPDSRQKGGA